jgi:hypothetical protein
MRYLVGFLFFLLALGTLRMVGCGDEGHCLADEDCNDENQCTKDYCDVSSANVCRYSTALAPFFCDFEETDEYPWDGRCEDGVCIHIEPECTTDLDCEPGWYRCGDTVCRNGCAEPACDLNRGECIYPTPINQGASCCMHMTSANRIPPEYYCTEYGTCQDGRCCDDTGFICLGIVNNPICVGKPDDTPCTKLDGSSGTCDKHQCCNDLGIEPCDLP